MLRRKAKEKVEVGEHERFHFENERALSVINKHAATIRADREAALSAQGLVFPVARSSPVNL